MHYSLFKGEVCNFISISKMELKKKKTSQKGCAPFKIELKCLLKGYIFKKKTKNI